MSHVIEHIPKYSLLWVVDALYYALQPGGILMLRTPNMRVRVQPLRSLSPWPMSTASVRTIYILAGYAVSMTFASPANTVSSDARNAPVSLRYVFLKENAISIACSKCIQASPVPNWW
jgi:2-polyprenyl-3-methyl-5-hydroxy-6-metoxy-1,4-benzoquinol methylase